MEITNCAVIFGAYPIAIAISMKGEHTYVPQIIIVNSLHTPFLLFMEMKRGNYGERIE